jgi:hypothetical protein
MSELIKDLQGTSKKLLEQSLELHSIRLFDSKSQRPFDLQQKCVHLYNCFLLDNCLFILCHYA